LVFAAVVCNKSLFQEFAGLLGAYLTTGEKIPAFLAQSRNKGTFRIEIGPVLDEIHALYKYTAHIGQRAYF